MGNTCPVLFSAIVIHWVTSKDRPTTSPSISYALSGQHSRTEDPSLFGRGIARPTSNILKDGEGGPPPPEYQTSVEARRSLHAARSNKANDKETDHISIEGLDAIDKIASSLSSSTTPVEDKKMSTPAPVTDAHLRSPSQVRVLVDYGSTLSHGDERSAEAMGNSIVIGSNNKQSQQEHNTLSDKSRGGKGRRSLGF
jgi:hypothetical protein